MTTTLHIVTAVTTCDGQTHFPYVVGVTTDYNEAHKISHTHLKDMAQKLGLPVNESDLVYTMCVMNEARTVGEQCNINSVAMKMEEKFEVL